MEQYPFLTPEWAEHVRRIKQRYLGDAIDQPGVFVNIEITDAPFGGGTLAARSSHGPVFGIEPGRHEQADFTVRVRYDVARDLVLDGSANALELAIANDDIEVDGDFDAFRDWWESRVGDADTRALEAEIRSITA